MQSVPATWVAITHAEALLNEVPVVASLQHLGELPPAVPIGEVPVPARLMAGLLPTAMANETPHMLAPRQPGSRRKTAVGVAGAVLAMLTLIMVGWYFQYVGTILGLLVVGSVIAIGVYDAVRRLLSSTIYMMVRIRIGVLIAGSVLAIGGMAASAQTPYFNYSVTGAFGCLLMIGIIIYTKVHVSTTVAEISADLD